MDKTIRKVTDQKAERLATLRYWRARPLGERLAAVWEVTVDAYAFKGIYVEEDAAEPRPQRTLVRTQRL